jgi:glycosyltransferase involved in cell wall biosynthesis
MMPRAIHVVHFFDHAGRNPLMMDFLGHATQRASHEGWRFSIGSLAEEGAFFSDAQELGVGNVALHAGSPRKYLGAVRELASWMKHEQIAVAHPHSAGAGLVSLLAARLAKVPVRVSTRHHSTERLLYGGRKARLLDRAVGRLSQRVIALSPAVARALEEIDGLAARKIVLIPNGYNWSRIHADAPRAAQMRRGWQEEWNEPGARLLCCVGRVTSEKGVGDLLRALADPALPASTHALIVGSGPDEAALKRLAGELGVSARAHFLGHRSDVFDVMAACDLIVQPSLSEAQNQVVNEAMALGLPVVATRVGAAPDEIEEGVSGWLAPPGDPRGLAQSVAQALCDPAQARRAALAGQERVRQAYPVERTVSAYLNLYEELLAARR